MCDKIVSSSLANHRLMISFLRCRIQDLPRNFKNTMKKFFFVDIAYYFCSDYFLAGSYHQSLQYPRPL